MTDIEFNITKTLVSSDWIVLRPSLEVKWLRENNVQNITKENLIFPNKEIKTAYLLKFG